MHVARNMLQGAAGGLLAGSLVGLTEATYLLATSGAPDLWSPFYAVVLYGLVFGLPFGLGTGLVVSLAERWFAITEARAFALGAIGAIVPLALFIGRYVVNKVVYLEQGVPMAGNLAILGVVGAVAALVLLAGPILLRGPLKPLLKASGLGAAWGGLALVTLGLAVAFPADDARGRWAHGKAAPASLADKPNVLFIMVDTLRADHLGAYGTKVKTPALDALANDAIVFEQAFAAASWTRASGASLFTSRLPSGHNAAVKAARLPDEVVTFAEALQPAGVTTGALINNINMTETFNFDQGFDTFIYEAPEYRFGGSESVFGLAMYKVVHKLAEKATGKHKTVEHFYQPADVVLGDAKGFISANRDGRWALFVHLMEPHDPYFEHPVLTDAGGAEYNGVGFARAEVEHPDPKDADYLKRVYADEVAFLDRKMAPFLQWLKDEGLYDNTMIVLTSDHGEEFYEHGGFWHGTTLYDEQIHVPLVVKLANNEHAGVRVPWQVRLLDVAPTITAAMGLPADPSWEGAPLVEDVAKWGAEAQASAAPVEGAPPLDGAAAEAADALGAPAEGAPTEAALAADDPCRLEAYERVVVAEEDFEGNQIAAIRSAGFKYIRANEGNPRGLPTNELFHVAADPGETKDLFGSNSPVCAKYPESTSEELGAALGRIIIDASKTASDGGAAEMDAAECERLKALGYLAADEDCG